MCSIIKCLWVLHFIIDLFRFTRWWSFRFYNPLDAHWNIKGPGMTDYQLAGQQNTLHPRATNVHLCFLLPLAISLGTGESCPCCFRDINHLITLPWGHILPIQEIQAAGVGLLTLCQRSVEGFSWECLSGCEVVLLTWDPWKKYHQVCFLSVRWPHCFVPWQDVQDVFWAEQLLYEGPHREGICILFLGCHPPLPPTLIKQCW